MAAQAGVQSQHLSVLLQGQLELKQMVPSCFRLRGATL